MRLLFSHPYFWPYVRRGAEREIHDIGAGLVARGHDVRLVTTAPRGITRRREVDGIRVRYVRTPLPRMASARGYSVPTAFAAVTAAVATGTRAEVVHCFSYGDAYGVVSGLRRRRRPPVVLKLTGTIRADRIDRLPVDARMFRAAVTGADAVWCNSAFAVAEMADFGVAMQVVPAGLDLATFKPTAPRADVPTVFAASASEDARKRFEDLVSAWPAVVDAVPDARLRVAGVAGDALRRRTYDALPARARAGVTFLGSLDDAALAAEYSAAWCSVTPAVFEALGLTTLESLACGTPVVAADSGAAPELLAAAATGRLFAPVDAAACAAELADAIARPPDDDVAGRCRVAAAPFAWELILPRIVAAYDELLAGRSRAS